MPRHVSRARSTPAPLPGTESRPRGLFVDRWGTLLELPPEGFVASFGEARFTPRAVDALFRASNAGWRIYLIGNEDAVADGRLSDAAWKRFEAELLAHLAGMGVRVRRNYACLDDPERGKGAHRRDSVYHLPNTGAMYHAMQHDGIELGRSWVVGDSALELAAGWRSGCRLAGVRTGLGQRSDEISVEPEVCAEHLADFVSELLSEGVRT